MRKRKSKEKRRQTSYPPTWQAQQTDDGLFKTTWNITHKRKILNTNTKLNQIDLTTFPKLLELNSGSTK
jgi:hypothetical protein